MQALEGIKVVELASYISTPAATALLGEFGADVIHVEPKQGDDSRALGDTEFLRRNGKWFQAVNYNKRSLCLDWRKPEAKEIIYELVKKADILTENFRDEKRTVRLGFDYDTIKKINPRIIYFSQSSFGREGPYATWASHDGVLQSFAGVAWSNRLPDGKPRTAVGLMAADGSTPMLAAFSMMVALYARDRTGEGQRVDLSLLSGLLQQLTVNLVNVPADTTPVGFDFATAYLRGAGTASLDFYQTADDRWINVRIVSDLHLKKFIELLGIGDILNERFPEDMKTEQLQTVFVSKGGEIYDIIQAVMFQKTYDEWVEIFMGNGLPFGQFNKTTDLFTDPQMIANEYVMELNHPVFGKIQQLGVLPKLEKTPGRKHTPAPMLGQHTVEILSELKYEKDKIDALREKEVIFTSPDEPLSQAIDK